MYTMGHKALVLNTLRAGDTVTAADLKILGFCDFAIADALGNATEGGDAFGAAAIAGVIADADFTTVVPANAAVGDTVEVKVTFTQNRYVSEYTSDFIKPGDTIIFQSTSLTALTATDVATQIAAGWLAYLAVFNVAQDPPMTVDAGTAAGDIQVVMTEAFLNIESVKIKLVPAGAKLGPAVDSTLALSAGTAAGLEGNGQGKFLEESIRTASYTNMDPYANKPNGSDSVDIRGSYKLYEFQASPNGEWGFHENLGTAIADQNLSVKAQKYTIYANEADGALITALDFWIAAVIAA